MCHRFTVLTREEVAEAVRAVEQRGELVPLAHDVQTRAQAHPGAQVTAFGIDFEPEEFTWGFSFEWSKNPVFNTRIESLLANAATWRDVARDGRCIIPVASFFEPHATETIASPRTGRSMKRPYEFSSPQGGPLLLAGVANDTSCSIVTTQPNAQVADIHNRMPLALTPEEAWAWLQGMQELWQLQESWRQLADRSRFALAVAPENLAVPAESHKAVDESQLSLF